MASKFVTISRAVQGSVVSVVICHECHSVKSLTITSSIINSIYVLLSFQIEENIEPFFDLSLPIVVESSAGKVANLF